MPLTRSHVLPISFSRLLLVQLIYNHGYRSNLITKMNKSVAKSVFDLDICYLWMVASATSLTRRKSITIHHSMMKVWRLMTSER
jgi:hypothetical protein